MPVLNGNNVGTPPFNSTIVDLVSMCAITGPYKRLTPNLIGVYSNLGPGTITLPSIASFSGGALKVVDLGNNASVNNWTISANGTDRISDHGVSTVSWPLAVNNSIAEFCADSSVWDVLTYSG